MTRTTNARIAGATFFFYLASGIASLMLAGRPHATVVLAMCTSFAALVSGVTLYAITREQDPDVAMLALVCRVIEGIPGPGEIYFAVGTMLFAWLLLRGRMLPIALGWLGVAGSALLVVILPMQRAGLFGGPTVWASSIAWFIRLPVLVFQIVLAVWLLTKGAGAPKPGHAA
jgi:hypothetical protein